MTTYYCDYPTARKVLGHNPMIYAQAILACRKRGELVVAELAEHSLAEEADRIIAEREREASALRLAQATNEAREQSAGGAL